MGRGATASPATAVREEAFADRPQKHRRARPRDSVMRAYRRSHGPYAELYEKLAT
jgi:hypothetical protein